MTHPVGLEGILSGWRLRGWSLVVTVLLLVYAGLAIASGLDRTEESDQRGRFVPGWPMAPFHALAQTHNALFSHDFGAAHRYAAETVRLSPMDGAAVGALGYSSLLLNDPHAASAAFAISDKLGWRDGPTQLFWIDQAIAAGDMKTAVRHLSAIFRISPTFPAREPLIERISAFEQGRDALAAELRTRPQWLENYLLQFDPAPNEQIAIARLDARADVVGRAGKGLWTCDQLAFLVDRLRRVGLLEDAARVWHANCPSNSTMIYDPDFDHLDSPDRMSGFNWVVRRDGDVLLNQTALPGGGHLLSAEVTSASTNEIMMQPVIYAPGTYRVIWRMPNTAPVDRAAFKVTLACNLDLSGAGKPIAMPGTPDTFYTDLGLPDTCPDPYLAFWIEPHHPVNLTHVQVEFRSSTVLDTGGTP